MPSYSTKCCFPHIIRVNLHLVKTPLQINLREVFNLFNFSLNKSIRGISGATLSVILFILRQSIHQPNFRLSLQQTELVHQICLCLVLSSLSSEQLSHSYALLRLGLVVWVLHMVYFSILTPFLKVDLEIKSPLSGGSPDNVSNTSSNSFQQCLHFFWYAFCSVCSTVLVCSSLFGIVRYLFVYLCVKMAILSRSRIFPLRKFILRDIS